jgi:CspA family cold shock protein
VPEKEIHCRFLRKGFFKELDTVNTGMVKWFNKGKGYGFIVADGGDKDIFVHHSNILMDGYRALTEGQKVEFEMGQGSKGPEATGVKIL